MKKLIILAFFFGVFSSAQSYFVGNSFEKISQKISVKVTNNTAKIIETFEIKNVLKTENQALWIEKTDSVFEQKMFVELAGFPIKHIFSKNDKVKKIWEIAANFKNSEVFDFYSEYKNLLASDTINFSPNETKVIKIEWETTPIDVDKIFQLKLSNQNNWPVKYTKIHIVFDKNPSIFYHFLPK